MVPGCGNERRDAMGKRCTDDLLTYNEAAVPAESAFVRLAHDEVFSNVPRAALWECSVRQQLSTGCLPICANSAMGSGSPLPGFSSAIHENARAEPQLDTSQSECRVPPRPTPAITRALTCLGDSLEQNAHRGRYSCRGENGIRAAAFFVASHTPDLGESSKSSQCAGFTICVQPAFDNGSRMP
jgi:hypothetical protein